MNKRFLLLPKISALIIAFSFLAAINFEAFHAGHKDTCHNDNCPVCLVLQIIHSTKKIVQRATTTSSNFTNLFYINILIISALLPVPATLVKQKIKLII